MKASFQTGIFRHHVPVPQRIAGFQCPGVYALINTGDYTKAAEIMKKSNIPFSQAYLFLSSYPDALSEYLRINALDKSLPDKQRVIYANSYVSLYTPILYALKKTDSYATAKANFISFLIDNQILQKFVSKSVIVDSLTQCNLLDVLQDIYLALQDWENYIKYYLEVQGTSKISVSTWRKLTSYIAKIPEMNIRQKIFKLFPRSQQKDLLRHWKELDLKRVLSVGADQAIRPIFPLLLDFVFEEPSDISLPEIVQPIFEDLLIDRYHGLNSPQYTTLYLVHLVRTENLSKLNDFFKTSTFNTGNQFFSQFWMGVKVYLLNLTIKTDKSHANRRKYFKKTIEPSKTAIKVQIEEVETQTQVKKTKSTVLQAVNLANIFSIFSKKKENKNQKDNEEEEDNDDDFMDDEEEEQCETGYLKLQIAQDTENNHIDIRYNPIEALTAPMRESPSKISIRLKQETESEISSGEDDISELERFKEKSDVSESEAPPLYSSSDQSDVESDIDIKQEEEEIKEMETPEDIAPDSKRYHTSSSDSEHEDQNEENNEQDKPQEDNKEDEEQPQDAQQQPDSSNAINIINADKKHKVRTEEEERHHKERARLRKIAAKVSDQFEKDTYKPLLNYGIELNSHASNTYSLSISYAVDKSLIEGSLQPLISLIEGPLAERFKFEEDKSELKECWMRIISSVYELYTNQVRFDALVDIPGISYLVRNLSELMWNPNVDVSKNWKENINMIISDIDEVKFYNTMLKANPEQRKIFISILISLDEANIKQGKFDKQFDDLISKNDSIGNMANDFKNCTGEETLVALHEYVIKQITSGEKTREMWITSLDDLRPAQHRALYNLPSDARAQIIYLIIKQFNKVNDENKFLNLFKQTVLDFKNETRKSYEIAVQMNDKHKFILAQNLLTYRQQGNEPSKYWFNAIKQFINQVYNIVKSIVKSTSEFEINSVQETVMKLMNTPSLSKFKEQFVNDEIGYQTLSLLDETQVIELAKILDKKVEFNTYKSDMKWDESIKYRWSNAIKMLYDVNTQRVQKLLEIMPKFDVGFKKLIFENLTTNIPEFKYKFEQRLRDLLHSFGRITRLDRNIMQTFLGILRNQKRFKVKENWDDAVKEFTNLTSRQYTQIAQILLGFNNQLAIDCVRCFEEVYKDKNDESPEKSDEFRKMIIEILQKRIEPLQKIKLIDPHITAIFGELYLKNSSEKESKTVLLMTIDDFKKFVKMNIEEPFKQISSYESFVTEKTKELILSDPGRFKENFKEFVKELTTPYNYVYAIDENLLKMVVHRMQNLDPEITDPALQFKVPFRELQKRIKDEMIPKVKKFMDIPDDLVPEVVKTFNLNDFQSQFDALYQKQRSKKKDLLNPIKTLDPKFMRMFILLYLNPANPERDILKRWKSIVDGTLNYLKERLLPFISKVKKIERYAVDDLLYAFKNIKDIERTSIKSIVEQSYTNRSNRYYHIFEMHQDVIEHFSSYIKQGKRTELTWQNLCLEYPKVYEGIIKEIDVLKELDESTKETVQYFLMKDGRQMPDQCRIFINKLATDLYALVGRFEVDGVLFQGVSLDNGALNILKYYTIYDYEDKPEKLIKWKYAVSLFEKTVVEVYESVSKHLKLFDDRMIGMFNNYMTATNYTHSLFISDISKMVDEYSLFLSTGSETLKILETCVSSVAKDEEDVNKKWNIMFQMFSQKMNQNYIEKDNIFDQLQKVPVSVQHKVIFYLEDVYYSIQSVFEQYSLTVKEQVYDMDPTVMHIVTSHFNHLIEDEVNKQIQEFQASQQQQKTQNIIEEQIANLKKKRREGDKEENNVPKPDRQVTLKENKIDYKKLSLSVWKKLFTKDDNDQTNIYHLISSISKSVLPFSISNKQKPMPRQDIIAIFDAFNTKLSLFKERLIASGKDSTFLRDLLCLEDSVLNFLLSIMNKVTQDTKQVKIKEINDRKLVEKRQLEFENRMKEIKQQEMKQMNTNLEMENVVESTQMTQRISYDEGPQKPDPQVIRQSVEEEVFLTEQETETKVNLSDDDKIKIWEDSVKNFSDFFNTDTFNVWIQRLSNLTTSSQISRFTMPFTDVMTINLLSVCKDQRLLPKKKQNKPSENVKKRLQKSWSKEIFDFLVYQSQPVFYLSKFGRFDLTLIQRWSDIYFDCFSNFKFNMNNLKLATKQFNQTFSVIDKEQFDSLKNSIHSLGSVSFDQLNSYYDNTFDLCLATRENIINLSEIKQKELKDTENSKQKIILKEDIELLKRLLDVFNTILEISSQVEIIKSDEENEKNKGKKVTKSNTSPLLFNSVDGPRAKLLKRFAFFIHAINERGRLIEEKNSIGERQNHIIVSVRLNEFLAKLDQLMEKESTCTHNVDTSSITRKMWHLVLLHFDNYCHRKILEIESSLLQFKDAAITALCTNLVDMNARLLNDEEKFNKNMKQTLEEYQKFVQNFEYSVESITGTLPNSDPSKPKRIGLTAPECKLISKLFLQKCMDQQFVSRLYQQGFYRRFNIDHYESQKRILNLLGEDKSSLMMLLNTYRVCASSKRFTENQAFADKYYSSIFKAFGKRAEWLMTSHEEIREIDGYKQYVTIYEANDTWKDLLSRAITSKIIRLDDIMKFIPEKMEITFLSPSIIDSIRGFQDESKQTEDKIENLKERSHQQRDIKSMFGDDQHAIDVESSELCEFCRQSLYTDKFIVFPCHHALHIHCFLENMDLFFEPVEQLNLIALQANALKREDTRAKLIDALSKSCPFCGELSVEILNKSFVVEDQEQIDKWALVPM
ncbi:hypothetical protein TVAG_238570 [Trichomonas vaginalis G3]|uniref:Uncharacterized protein n=1 Tax=Trichomonas vaginalis (strain ATCC PRA-98 / G3) TaxID=412133 RepID=A2DG89_TRIV3|nr:vacuolar protein sorting-associated protein 18-like protein family [Trichomonas vaginalis G3]EAY20485.1 hypothetical protein TVAG_238570 [Trichomonas vaginalis G3]KAI5488346.1 vacuolar protein sorting-associated protein 18-like protein family [Trichomonas vaginalis G3]|eukprot:XP_001581471.1 hypothetical protein [Trichomonas vaginalis G3]